MKQMSPEAGATFVDISVLGKDAANQAHAERPIAHDGVAAHLRDKGMKAIADELCKAITARMSAAPKDAKQGGDRVKRYRKLR